MSTKNVYEFENSIYFANQYQLSQIETYNHVETYIY